jgi:heme/copper-type cytochrome/quinol oxidase subunit 2
VPDIQHVEAQFQLAQAGAETLDATVAAASAQRAGRDRSFIVWLVISLYVGSVSVAILYVVVRSIGGGGDAETGFNNISEIIKVAVLPVVTLVIGYYFGTKSD